MEAAAASSTTSTLIQLTDSKQIMINGLTVDFKDMRTIIGHALKLLTMAHAVLLQCHWASLHPYLDYKFQYLTHDSNPSNHSSPREGSRTKSY